MATIIFAEPGSDATNDLSFFSATAGTVVSATDQKHTGPNAIKCSTGVGITATFTRDSILADTGRAISFWMYFDVLPSAGNLLNIIGGGPSVYTLSWQAGGILRQAPVGATFVDGTQVFAANTWYRCTVAYSITNATTFTFKFYVHGVLDSTANAGTLTNTGTNAIRLGILSTAGANKNIWFDDIYVDDRTDSSNPGAVVVTAKRPFANGTTNGFSTQIGSGGSGYGSGHSPQVNERPLSQTNGWSMIGAGSAITEEYNVENAATGDVSLTGATIKGVIGWVFGKSALSETGSMVVDGTSANIALTSTATLFRQVSATPTTYPAGTGTDIGMVTSTTVTTVSLYECGMLVAYIPPATSSMFLVM